ncbi:hypothetical protein EDD16DRAFT_1651392 [Pisolithus croceorrhizus]|nr:hypothetical protein EDD16DRAFT_1651392 [Pisolithus croceorrhizus]KAI6161884.1 hypothetical protein EDD17DRAFT_1583474 [Pisolithus thermaeus]
MLLLLMLTFGRQALDADTYVRLPPTHAIRLLGTSGVRQVIVIPHPQAKRNHYKQRMFHWCNERRTIRSLQDRRMVFRTKEVTSAKRPVVPSGNRRYPNGSDWS